ncbi:hypothetical protein FVEG_17456 [Fusarium verticillioides 7600]|uniref:Uncharacterized protein n=1 Tax=Gibberella moniliformis (strain M3125 / FGSC 7600) TaxID=334819 RepID=W7NFM6_GIBM7|nr:hypothetical protein FVEG_17456 [Fusarium verticillioides 7600]EWG55082.1 hypothetical protein FVEG_17456 [Fusarium verticillioides 7600]
MQLRTECVGLNWYLNKCHVLRDVKLPDSDTVVRLQVSSPFPSLPFRRNVAHAVYQDLLLKPTPTEHHDYPSFIRKFALVLRLLLH